jgi:hypothetical protein
LDEPDSAVSVGRRQKLIIPK